MLIEFSVANYRSIREKQTLSMVATASNELRETNTIETNLKGISPLLPCVALYGANASGKSNLIQAMQVMRKIILNSNKGQEQEPIAGIDPHALLRDQPTEFEIIFIQEGVRYQYGFSATRSAIHEEWLFAFPSLRAQKWLEREGNERNQWYINPKLKGDREVWRNATRSNALFLSTAAGLNGAQCKAIMAWFGLNLAGGKTADLGPFPTVEFCDDEVNTLAVRYFLQKADLGIADFQITKKEFSLADYSGELPAEIHQQLTKLLPGGKPASIQNIHVHFVHTTENGESFLLDQSVESDGTRRLFELAGPWLHRLKNGLVTVVDELNDSLHPTLLRFLVALFHNKEVNKRNAQLIFTAHDTTILDLDLLRRDQIWFIEKDKNQSSQLYPLSQFKPRKEEALQKNYLQGRYGALPYINHLFTHDME